MKPGIPITHTQNGFRLRFETMLKLNCTFHLPSESGGNLSRKYCAKTYSGQHKRFLQCQNNCSNRIELNRQFPPFSVLFVRMNTHTIICFEWNPSEQKNKTKHNDDNRFYSICSKAAHWVSSFSKTFTRFAPDLHYATTMAMFSLIAVALLNQFPIWAISISPFGPFCDFCFPQFSSKCFCVQSPERTHTRTPLKVSTFQLGCEMAKLDVSSFFVRCWYWKHWKTSSNQNYLNRWLRTTGTTYRLNRERANDDNDVGKSRCKR